MVIQEPKLKGFHLVMLQEKTWDMDLQKLPSVWNSAISKCIRWIWSNSLQMQMVKMQHPEHKLFWKHVSVLKKIVVWSLLASLGNPGLCQLVRRSGALHLSANGINSPQNSETLAVGSRRNSWPRSTCHGFDDVRTCTRSQAQLSRSVGTPKNCFDRSGLPFLESFGSQIKRSSEKKRNHWLSKIRKALVISNRTCRTPENRQEKLKAQKPWNDAFRLTVPEQRQRRLHPLDQAKSKQSQSHESDLWQDLSWQGVEATKCRFFTSEQHLASRNKHVQLNQDLPYFPFMFWSKSMTLWAQHARETSPLHQTRYQRPDSQFCFSCVTLKARKHLLVAPSYNVTPIIHAYLRIPFHSQTSPGISLPQNVHATQQPSCFVVDHQQRACSFQAWPSVQLPLWTPQGIVACIQTAKEPAAHGPLHIDLSTPDLTGIAGKNQQIFSNKSCTLC